MSDTARMQSRARREHARLKCAENREYTKALIFLTIICGVAFVFIGWWPLVLGASACGVAIIGGLALWNVRKRADPIRHMDRHLPKISFDQEV